MKAVILERKGEDAAVLAENGTFMKVHRPGEIGEEIDIAANVTPMPRLRQRWVRGLAAAALVLVVTGGAYHYTAVSVSAYVSVDAGGSSIEFTVNRLGKVTSVVSVSETDSGLAEVLSGSVSGMSVEDAVTSALDTLTEKGALSPQNDIVIVGITSGSDSQAESLENAIMNNAGHSVYTVRVSDEDREEAHRQELGGGLYVYENEETADIADDSEPEEMPDIEVLVTTAAEDEEIITGISVPEEEETASDADTVTPVQTSYDITETRNNEADMQPAADDPPPMPESMADTAEPPLDRGFGQDNEGPQPPDPENDEKPYDPGSDIPPAQADPQNGSSSDMAPQQQNQQPSDMTPPPQPGEMPSDTADPRQQFNGGDPDAPDRMQMLPGPDGFNGQPMAMQQAPVREWQSDSRYGENTF